MFLETGIDDEYGDDVYNGTFNVTTEGLQNETEVPPDVEEEGKSDNPSSESGGGDNYEAQLKNLQVSLRYEKVRKAFYNPNKVSVLLESCKI